METVGLSPSFFSLSTLSRSLKCPKESFASIPSALADHLSSHGTFRPSLKALVQENDDQRVRAITRDGLSIDLIHHGNQKSAGDALDVLTQLRGVGPATASLLLSVGNPKMAPFFSDELYRWCFWQEGKGNGWDRTIKYTRKEYLALFVQVQRLRERLQLQSSSEVTAVELEKVAYVLGKRAQTGNLVEVQPGHEQGGSKKRSASERDDLKLSATIDDEEDPRKNKKRPREARLNHPTAASSRPVRKR